MNTGLRNLGLSVIAFFAMSASASACLTQLQSSRGDVLGTYRAATCQSSRAQCNRALDRLQSGGHRLGARCVTYNDRLDPRPRPPVPGRVVTRRCTYNLIEHDVFGGRRVVDRFTRQARGVSGSNVLARACDLARQDCRMNRYVGQTCERAPVR